MARTYIEVSIDPDVLGMSREAADAVNQVYDEWLEGAMRDSLWQLAKQTGNDYLVVGLEESYNRTEPFWGDFHRRLGYTYGAGKLYRSLTKH